MGIATSNFVAHYVPEALYFVDIVSAIEVRHYITLLWSAMVTIEVRNFKMRRNDDLCAVAVALNSCT